MSSERFDFIALMQINWEQLLVGLAHNKARSGFPRRTTAAGSRAAALPVLNAMTSSVVVPDHSLSVTEFGRCAVQ